MNYKSCDEWLKANKISLNAIEKRNFEQLVSALFMVEFRQKPARKKSMFFKNFTTAYDVDDSKIRKIFETAIETVQALN